MDAKDDFLWTEWFGDIVVRADFEAFHPILHLAAGCEHEDGDSRGLAVSFQSATDLKSCHAGKHQVEHHGIRPLGAHCSESSIARVCDLNFKTSLFEMVAQQIHHIGFVFYQ